MDVSVVITSFNVRDLLAQCLESVLASRGLSGLEVFVVDNDSVDGSPEMVRTRFPGVTLISNDANLGFAKANNSALRLSQGRYVLLLNPDTRIDSGTLAGVMAVMDERADVGVAGVKLLREDGEMDQACRRGFPTPMNSLARFLHLDRIFPKSRWLAGYNLRYEDPNGVYEVDSVVGAFMFCRREILAGVGMLDERFFMFGEDLDWCFRIKRGNWKVLYLGSHTVTHVKGASTRQSPAAMNFHFHRAMLIFHRKHLVNRYPFFVNWLVSGGIGLRWVMKSVVLFVKGRWRPAPRKET